MCDHECVCNGYKCIVHLCMRAYFSVVILVSYGWEGAFFRTKGGNNWERMEKDNKVILLKKLILF